MTAMTFWIIAAVILAAALVILALALAKISARSERRSRAMAHGRATVAGREKWEAKMAAYFNGELGMDEEDE